MRKFWFPLCLSFLLLASCEEDPNPGTTDPITPVTPIDTTRTVAPAPAPLPDTHDCEIEGLADEADEFWVRPAQVLVGIINEDGGENLISRVRAVSTKDCQEIFNSTLPANEGDYAYYLASPQYNSSNRLVGIHGFNRVYVYDAERNQLSPELRPEFQNNRIMSDAQSGAIERLEIWEDYIFGYATDMGVFAFDLTDATEPKALLPFADYKAPDDSYASAFLLPQADGKAQILVPTWDHEQFQLDMNPIFNRPVRVSTEAAAGARNNEYLVIYEYDEAGERMPVALDMQKRERVALPDEVARQNVSGIIQHLRRNR